MKVKKTCPNCGNKSMILEPSMNDSNILRKPLICRECRYIDLIVEEEQDYKIK